MSAESNGIGIPLVGFLLALVLLIFYIYTRIDFFTFSSPQFQVRCVNTYRHELGGRVIKLLTLRLNLYRFW